MNYMKKDWLYEDIESVELRLEMDDPLKTGISLTGGNANEFPEKYTWSLKVYEQGQDSYPIEERDIGRELLEDDKIEDFPQFRDVSKEEIDIDRQIPDEDPHNYLKEVARFEADEMADALEEEYGLDVEVNRNSFYSPQVNFSTRIYV